MRRAQVVAGEIVTLCVYSFGGTTLASMLLGIPAFVLGNKYALFVVVGAYFIVNVVLGATDAATTSTRVWSRFRYPMMMSAEIFRTIVMRSMMMRSYEKMPVDNLLTHVIIGFVAGCGGMLFMQGPNRLLVDAEIAPSPFFLLGTRVALGSLIFVSCKSLWGVNAETRDLTLSVWNVSTGIGVAMFGHRLLAEERKRNAEYYSPASSTKRSKSPSRRKR